MNAEWIRNYYKVPARKGMHVTVDGSLGTITGYRDQYLLVRFVTYPDHFKVCHPHWNITYHTPQGPVSFQ